MEKISPTRAKKISSAIKKMKKKYVSLDLLSHNLGIYSDVLGQELSYFEPMILMDSSLNMVDVVPALDAYVAEAEEEKAKEPAPKKKVVVRSSELEGYTSTIDYIYRHLTGAGGLLYPSYKMNEKELRLMSKLIDRDLEEFAPKRKKKKSSRKK